MPERIPSLQDMREYRRTHPFTVWEGEKGGSARGQSYRTRLRAIIAAWWASLYSGHDVWIERDMPQAVLVSIPPKTGPSGPAGDSGASRPPRGPSGVSRPRRASDGPPPPPAPPQRPSRGSGL